MLSFDECREIIQVHIDGQNLSGDVKLALTGWTDEGEFCFAFGINSAEFVKSGDFDHCLVGAGPTLVDRRNGKIIPMANMGTMENYEKRGDPHNGLSGLLRITGTHEEGLRREAFKCLREVTERSVADCRDILDRMGVGEPFIFDTDTWRDQDVVIYIDRFREFGFDVRRLTTFESRAQTIKG